MEQFCGILCIINKLFVYAFCLYSVLCGFFSHAFFIFTIHLFETQDICAAHLAQQNFMISNQVERKIEMSKTVFTSNFMLITLTYTLIISFYWFNCSIAIHRLLQRICNRHIDYDKSISSHFSRPKYRFTQLEQNKSNKIWSYRFSVVHWINLLVVMVCVCVLIFLGDSNDSMQSTMPT